MLRTREQGAPRPLESGRGVFFFDAWASDDVGDTRTSATARGARPWHLSERGKTKQPHSRGLPCLAHNPINREKRLMAFTQVSDVIVPEIFLPYMIERTAELSNLVSSGIINNDAQFVSLVNGGGATANMPFWIDLQGTDQVLSDDGTNLTTKKIGASSDVAVQQGRGDAWAVNDLAKLLSGDDPMAAIAELVANYWMRKEQAQTLSLLAGIFGTAGMANSISAIYQQAVGQAAGDANTLHGGTFADTIQLLGDSKEKLVAVIMHSAVENSLVKKDLIDFIPDSEGKLTIKVFMGKRVIVDDGMPTQVVNGLTVYTTYIFGDGAIAFGVGTDNNPVEGGFGTWQLEFARNGLGGTTFMINRRKFIMHCRGVKWLGAAMAGLFPTNAELANPANWLRVYEQKNVRVVAVQHNIPA